MKVLRLFVAISIASAIGDANAQVFSYLDVQGPLYHRDNIYMQNHSGTAWIPWATRYTTATESKMDLPNIRTILATGSMGLGTTVPIARLDVNGYGGVLLNSINKIVDADNGDMVAIRSATKASVLNLVSSRGDAGPLGGLIFTATGAWSDSHLNIAGILGSRVSANGQTGGGRLTFWTKDDNSDVPRERMRLDHAGRFGIGTTNPLATLDVYGPTAGSNPGDYALISRISTAGGTSGNLFAKNTWVLRDAQGSDWMTARLHDGISVDGSFTVPGQSTRTWWERDPFHNIQSWGQADQTYMTLKNGALGIGTKNPDHSLTVNGVIHSKEVLVDVNIPVPDYVFEENYELLPLADLEAYVRTNKHLPDVPSAKQIEAEGLNLKEMNLLLLKKVEELTLHLIEQSRQNGIQQSQIEFLMKENEALKQQINQIQK